MKNTRLLFGLWLLLTIAPLYAEPLTLTFSALPAGSAHRVSNAGAPISFISGGASWPGGTPIIHQPAALSFTRDALTLDLAQATDILSFDRAFSSRRDPAMGHTVLTLNPNVSTFTFENLSNLTIPEPAALVLLGTGLAALAALTRKRKHNKPVESVESIESTESIESEESPPSRTS